MAVPPHMIILQPKINKVINNRIKELSNISCNISNGLVLKDQTNYKYLISLISDNLNNRFSDLEILDDLFLDFGMNKVTDHSNIYLDLTFDDEDFQTFDPRFRSHYLGTDLKTVIDAYDNNMCSNKYGILTPKGIELNSIECVTRANGSQAFILNYSDSASRMLKVYPLITSFDRKKFFVEGWVSDYLQRKVLIYRHNNGNKICENMISMYDIFLCREKLHIIDSTTKKACKELENYPDKTLFGFIMMEKILNNPNNNQPNTLNNIPNDSFDFGVLFEYLYGKLVCYKHANIIFTDQANLGNCAFSPVDYIRKYTIKHNSDELIIYIKNQTLVKIFDLDNIKICNNTNNFFFNKDDIKLFIENKPYNSAPANIDQEMNDKLKQIERENTLRTLFNFIEEFDSNKQVNNFIPIIRRNMPADYGVEPTDKSIRIKSFEFTF
jgi:hypothetical protein